MAGRGRTRRRAARVSSRCLEQRHAAGDGRIDASSRHRARAWRPAGRAMVRAAYSSGKPTLAVGAGNVPVYIHRSVKDVREAALMAIDLQVLRQRNGVRRRAIHRARRSRSPTRRSRHSRRRALLFLDAAQQERLAASSSPSAASCGRKPLGFRRRELARRSGVTRCAGSQGPGGRSRSAGRRVPLSQRNSRPGAFVLPHGRRRSRVPALPGNFAPLAAKGHTLGLHCRRSDDVIARFSTLPARASSSTRQPCSAGWVTVARPIPPSCWEPEHGAAPIVSDNVTPLHLINIKRVAHEVRPWRTICSTNMGL